MIDTQYTNRCADLLDQAEQQAAAAIALGRRLLAAPHPDRPIHQLHVQQLPGGLGLTIWAALNDVSAIEAWASLLDTPVVATPYEDRPADVHFQARGNLEDVPLSVWMVATVPITAAAIVSRSGKGWRVSYRQGGARKSAPMATRAAAQHWIALHAPARVSA